MISEENLFKNHFADREIINTRLEVYAGDCIGKLTAGNTGGRFDLVISRLGISFPAFTGNVTNVDTALNLQKGGTMTVEGVHTLFKVTMSHQEPFIAVALGGKDTAAYLTFYPHMVSEYSVCPQRDMVTLTSRVKGAAIANATALGTTLTALLSGFQDSWKSSKVAQELQKGTVSTGREIRGSTRTTLEKDLCYALDIIGSIDAGNVDFAKSFVNFSLLFSVAHHKHIRKSGSILVKNKVQTANQTFNAEDEITIENTCTNADIEAYLVAHPDDVPTLIVTVKPGKRVKKAAELFGDLAGTFLMLRDASDINDASYIVEYLE
jgi:hypothetical protein